MNSSVARTEQDGSPVVHYRQDDEMGYTAGPALVGPSFWDMSAPLREIVEAIATWLELSPVLLAELIDPDRTGTAMMFVSEHRDAVVWPMGRNGLITLAEAAAAWAKDRGRLVVIIRTDRPGMRYVAPCTMAGH